MSLPGIRRRLWLTVAILGFAQVGAARAAVAQEDAHAAARDALAQAAAAQESDVDRARLHVARALSLLEPAGADAEAAPLYVEIHALARDLGDVHTAHDAIERAHALLKRTRPADDAELRAVRLDLATAAASLGDFARARDLLEPLVVQLDRLLAPDADELLRARQNLALALQGLGRPAEARPLLEEVVAARARTRAEEDYDRQAACLNLANALWALGELRQARALLERVVAAFERTLPADDPALHIARANLAATLADLGDLAGARALQETALATLSRTWPDDHPDVQRARIGLAVTLAESGDAAGARVLFERVVDVWSAARPDDDPELQRARQNLAGTSSALGEWEAALALDEQVLRVFERTLPDDHADLRKARSNLATTRSALGDFTGARALEERVLASLPGDLSDGDPDRLRVAGNLAVSIALEATAAAPAPEAADALDAARVKAFRKAAGMHARALVHQTLDARFAGSVREVEERLANATAKLGRSLSFAAGLGVFAPDDDEARLAFLASESARGAALVVARLAARAGADAVLARSRDELVRARADVTAAAGRDDELLARAIERRDAAERALVEHAVAAGAGAWVEALPRVEALAAALGPDGAAVAFRRHPRWSVDGDGRLRGRDVFTAFVVRNDALTCVDLGAAADVEAAVERWRAVLGAVAGRGVGATAAHPDGGAARGAEERDASLAIRALAWDPLRAALGSVARVVIAADDVLHAVPFDALPLGDGLLGDDVAIETRLSLAELLWTDDAPAGDATLLALGAAAFGATPAGSGFDPLPSTGVEARGVAAAFEQVFGDGSGTAGETTSRATVLLHREATRDAVARLAPRVRFVHLATHGWFAPGSMRMAERDAVDAAIGRLRQSPDERVRAGSPMVLCGLALAGANLPPDDLGRHPGLVTAEEIAGWDLSNCELAVLSACDTSAGIRRAGQGVASLQKALHMAGARSVIASLWKVPDEATKTLMLDFYRRLWIDGKPTRQALWEAKMALRDAKDPDGTPTYATRDWAAWVLTGDPH